MTGLPLTTAEEARELMLLAEQRSDPILAVAAMTIVVLWNRADRVRSLAERAYSDDERLWLDVLALLDGWGTGENG